MATIVSSQSMSITERENSRIACVVMPIPTSNASTPEAAVTPMTTTTRSLAVAYIQYRPYRPKAMKIIGFRTRAITRKGTHSGRVVAKNQSKRSRNAPHAARKINGRSIRRT